MVILVWNLWCWVPGPRRPQGHEWHAPPLVSTIRARICGVIYIYDIYTIYVCIYSGSMWFHVIPGGSIKSSQGKQSAAWNIKKTAVRLHTIIHYLTYLTIQNCRVKSAACGEWLGMRRRHFCDCLAGHWATICEAMRGNKKWQPRHGRHHAGADIERKDTCGLCQSHGRSYSSFVSQPKLKKHFKTAGSQTQISAGQTAINSICSKHEVSDLIFHSLQDAIQEVSNDYSTL